MGCCCSCLKDGSSTKETEMQHRRRGEGGAGNANGGGGADQQHSSSSLCISRKMSAPSIDVKDGIFASGYGMAIVGISIEQDAAYWELHVETPDHATSPVDVMFGVATKKDQKFYEALTEENHQAEGTELMKSIQVKNSDVIGVALQQSDLPMIQFTLNGEPLHDLAINRFRGQVHPSIYLPPENEGLSIQFVFLESNFQQLSPHARFGPVIIARGLL